jgi:hypothetical protein
MNDSLCCLKSVRRVTCVFRDESGRLLTLLVAIDAMEFKDRSSQFTEKARVEYDGERQR